MLTSTDEDLRRCIRDLIALSTLRAAWTGRNLEGIATGLADAVLSTMRAGLVHVFFQSSSGQAIEVTRMTRDRPIEDRAPEIISMISTTLKSDDVPAVLSTALDAGGERLSLSFHPIGLQGEWGALVVGSREPNFPSDLDNLLIGFAANQAAISLNSARLLAERQEAEKTLREKNQFVETLHQIGVSLTSQLDLQKLLQSATDAATKLTGAQYGAFFYNSFDENGEAYLLYAISGVSRKAFAHSPNPRNTALFEATFRGAGTIRLDDVTKDPLYGKNAPYFDMAEGHLPIRSYLAIPVTSRSGEVSGGLLFGHEQIGVFSESHERIAAGIAAWAGVAVENARLFQKTRQNENQLRRQQAKLKELNTNLEERAIERSRYLHLLREIAVAANEATSVEAPFQFAVNRICAHQNWCAGHAYLLSRGTDPWVSSGVWFLRDPHVYD
ncbi:MAG: GAF domain-containing protein, partial [Candidatus Binatia bacterium]